MAGVRVAGNGGKVKRIYHWILVQAQGDGELVFLGGQEIELRGEFVVIVDMGAQIIVLPGWIGGDQAFADVVLGHGIKLGWIDDGAVCTSQISLEVGIRLKKCCHAWIRVGAVARGSSIGKISR